MAVCDYCGASFQMDVDGFEHNGENICDGCNEAAAAVRRTEE